MVCCQLYLPCFITNIAVDFFNQVNMLYSTVTDFCSLTVCPTCLQAHAMNTSGQTNPSKTVNQFVCRSWICRYTSYIQSRIDDEATFPSKIGAPFPKNFGGTVKTIWRRLFRVYAHVYCEHFSVIVGLGLESHLNTSFKHFVLFAKQFEYSLPEEADQD